MYKYNGLLVHQSYDDKGLIEVIESEGIRSLHFGNEIRQSSIRLSQPHALYSRYTQAMMSWLLFKAPVDKALMIGLGGGVLANFFLYHFEKCYFKVIEYRRGVVKVARSHFNLPTQDPRLKILIADGSEYIRSQSLKVNSGLPLIIVDAFDEVGIADVVTNRAFFDNCKTLLKNDGLLVINLWSTNEDLYQNIVWNLQQVFNERVLFLPIRGRGNIIAFVFKGNFSPLNFKKLSKQAEQLQQQYFLDFTLFLTDLKKNNWKMF